MIAAFRFSVKSSKNIIIYFSRWYSINQDDVIIENIGSKGVITLNRPHIYNALTASMLEKIFSTLKKWESHKTFVLVKGVNENAFSIGGDLKTAMLEDLKGKRHGEKYFKYQYLTKKLITSYKIPYISFVDGMVMGSATGLSFLGQYPITTERTVFAMPEAKVGLIPDGGSSYILPRLTNHIGWYIGLTGYQLKGSDIVKAGVASYYCHSKDLKYVEKELFSSTTSSMETILNTFNKSISDECELSLKPIEKKINHCFSAESIEEVISRLADDDSPWAKSTIDTLNAMCPISLKITLKELQRGKQLSIHDCLLMEYRLSMNCLKNKNVYEGVRAIFIDKDQNPKWKPPTLSEVTDEYVENHFSKVTQEEELKSVM